MSVERVDFYSDEEYQQALQQEENENNQPQQQGEPDGEPDVVPCYICGGQMYEVSNEPKENICDECKKKVKGENQ